jgi:hypothetical protein
MRRPILPLAVVLVLGPAVGAEAQTGAPSVAYVQATVTESNPAAGSLGFVTASGRTRMLRASGSALLRVPNLRPGDEVILTLEGPSDRPIVTAVKVSGLVAAAPSMEPASQYAQAMMLPGASRPSWPNPYSRINPGLPMRPTRAARARGGTFSVMPAVLAAAPAPPQAMAAPAVLTPTSAAAVGAAPAAIAVRDEASSTVDALRARGARDYEAAVSRLAAEARTADAAYARYESSCPASAGADEGSRPWFGLPDGAAASQADAGCASLVDEIARLAAPIKAGMIAAQENARKAWVLPGTLRDIRRRHSMEWSGWDR